MALTIRISDEIEEYLSRERHPGESWTKVLRRLLKDFDEFMKLHPKQEDKENFEMTGDEEDSKDLEEQNMRQFKITKTRIDIAIVQVNDDVPDEKMIHVLGGMDEHEQIEWEPVDRKIEWCDEISDANQIKD